MTKQIFKHYESGKGLNPNIVEVTADVKSFGELKVEKGSKNPIIGFFAKQSEKVRGRSTGSNKSKNAFPVYKVVKAVKMSDAEFLDLAVSEDEARPVLMTSHGKWSADGFRLHILENVKENACKCKSCKNKYEGNGNYPLTPDFKQVIPVNHKGVFTLNRDAILEAANSCKVFAREGSNVVRVNIGQDSIEFSAISEEFGNSVNVFDNSDGKYTYSKTGIDLLIAFNVDFLMDAVKGMGEIVSFSYAGDTRPALVSDGNRSAVLMPMKLN